MTRARSTGVGGSMVLLAVTIALGQAGPAADEEARPAEPKPADVPGTVGTLLEKALAGPLADGAEVVLAARQFGKDGHWYANFSYFAESVDRLAYAPGGKLYRLDLATGRLQTLLDDPSGGVRDPQVHYDGRRILFSYRRGDSSNYHLYEIQADGTGLKQLTDGPWDDIEPTYLPDGRIMFVSSRCKRWVNCWLTQVATLHVCEADGSDIRIVSSNTEHDNTPWPMPDGTVLYTRWEYMDRSQVHYHHLWSINPDGTGQMTFFGNLHPGVVMIDAKPVPGTGEIVSIFSPGHGQREHAGPVTLVDARAGPDAQAFARPIGRGNDFRDPYPLSADLFLVARKDELLLMDRGGQTQTVFALPEADRKAGLQLNEPRPLQARRREHILPDRIDRSEPTGRLMLVDVNLGRNMDGVKPGEITHLLVLETLPKPINYTGGMDPLSYGGTFTLERIVGTVPVEEDGSAYFELPANRAFFFVAMDENNLSVKRMQSFTSVAPGETTSCIGCHERRTQAPPPVRRIAAAQRAPSVVTPIPNVPDVIDFPRDVQPILDRHCVRCHDYEKHAGGNPPSAGPAAGGVLLTGDRGPMFSHSYLELTIRRQFVDGRNEAKSNLPPRPIGTSASPLMKKLDGSHHGVRMAPAEIDVIRYWIESGAAYPGTYAALGSGMIGGYAENKQVETDHLWPEAKSAGEAIRSRCATCHGPAGNKRVPMNLSDEMGVSFWQISTKDPRLLHSRHRVWNLSRPEKSCMLLAPLAKNSGGFGTCTPPGGAPVFADTSDPGYRAILALCVAGKQRLDESTRFDMADFKPPRPYLREMTRYGILPADRDPDQAIDPYAMDRAYWRSLWYVPPAAEVRRDGSGNGQALGTP